MRTRVLVLAPLAWLITAACAPGSPPAALRCRDDGDCAQRRGFHCDAVSGSCVEGGTLPLLDAGPGDGGRVDAGADGGPVDSGPLDGGPADGGPVDGGAGDGGAGDGGAGDGGAGDGGTVEGWDLPSWRQRVGFRLQQDALESVEGLTALVYLPSALRVVFDTSTTGQVRFVAADGAALPFEVEEWRGGSISPEAFLWVRLPPISPNDDGDEPLFWMYFDPVDESAPSTSDGPAVWDGFVGVWHFDGNLNDSTVNSLDGPGTTGITYQGSLLGKGGLLGVDDVFEAFSNDTTHGLTLQQGTISFWVSSISSLIADDGIVVHASAEPTALGDGYGTQIELHAGVVLVSEGETWAGKAFKFTSDGGVPNEIDSAPFDSSWHHVTVVWSTGDRMELFVDGVPGSPSDYFGDQTAPVRWLRIGGTVEGERGYAGQLDEVRVSAIPRSAEWVRLSYLSMNKVLFEISEPEVGQ